MSTTDPAPSEVIDQVIDELGDWRAATLTQLRALIHDAAPDIVEDAKWRKPSNDAGQPTS